MIVILPPAGRGTAPTFSSKASLGSKLSRPTLAQLGPDGGSSLAARLSIRWFERRDNQDAGLTSTQLGSRGSGNLLVPAIRDWNGAADRNCEELFHRSVVKCAQRCQLVRGVGWYDC